MSQAPVKAQSFFSSGRSAGGLLIPTEGGASLAAHDANQASPPLAVDMLLQCHQRVQAQCDTLLRLQAHLERKGVDAQAQDAARAVMRYFDTAAVLHHADEEQDWLGVLRPLWRTQPDKLALLDRLCAEHRMLEALWRDIQSELQAVLNADQGHRLVVHKRVWQAFVEAYQAHIAFEERVWLPLAQQTVSEPDLIALGASMVKRRRSA